VAKQRKEQRSDEKLTPPKPGTLGWRLRRARRSRSLNSVATPAEITPAYLQKLERNNVQKPSPNVLYALAEELDVPYEDLMESAGYVVPGGDAAKVKRGNVLAYALSSENLTEDEAAKLLEYLDWYRHEKSRNP
jgi:HTH-type transcriptional regulator, competence development regulator